MDERRDVVHILQEIDLDDIEETVSQPYHREGAGRPPRSPIGIFKALVVKRLRCLRSDRELYRRLWESETLRMICDIEEHEKPYHPSQITRFRDNVGPERLEELISGLVLELVEGGLITGEELAMDATFIKAWSRRNPADDSVGLSDPEARVGRDGKSYDLGYKPHIVNDVESDIPLAVVVAPANDNEKKHVETLMKKASRVVQDMSSVVGDSQYSSERVRMIISGYGARPVIPYMSNQLAGEDALRVDKYFRVSGSEEEKRLYEVGRASVERVNSRLDLVGLECFKLRGLRKALFHVLMCVVTLLLVAVAALRLGRPCKARSVISFYW